ncbi:MAG: hypothetical protein BM485_10030 [Desulfobulbaceae bacterium DB1]|nr:MAG: hypothetical protein BM485_10030 [Desulfobulbaceae bacterium DB1]
MKAKEYWRDVVSKILGWGTAVLILIAGWGVDKGSEFEFFGENIAAKQRACLLLFYSVVFAIGIISAVVWIYRRHLNKPTDPEVDATVTPQFFGVAYVCFIAISLVGLALILGYY